MKYSTLASSLISGLMFCASSFAQETSYIAPLATESVTLDFHATSYMIAVGERGHILYSEDGENFTQLNVPTQSTLTAVTIIEDKIWAVGHDAVIVHSSDRGQSWEVQHIAPEMERPFLDVQFVDEEHGIAIGAYGLFFRTTDGGKNWAAERHAELLSAMDREYLEELRQESEEYYIQELDSILPHLNRVSVNGDEMLMAGEMGLLAKSSDQGHTWTRMESGYMGSFFDITSLESQPGTYVAVGLRGNIYVGNSDGTWNSVQSCSTATLNSVAPINSESIVAVGNNGTIVQLSLPLNPLFNQPVSECNSLSGVTMSQTESKTAVVAVTEYQDKLWSATAEGIKPLILK